MDVGLDIRPEITIRSQIGYIVVDNHVDLLDIDTSSDDIGGNEDFGLAVSESIEDVISVIRLLVSVERSDRVTFISQPLGDSIGSIFSLQMSASTPHCTGSKS